MDLKNIDNLIYWIDKACDQANASKRADSELYHRHFITLAVENLAKVVRELVNDNGTRS